MFILRYLFIYLVCAANVSFVCIGDWGSPPDHQLKVARALDAFVDQTLTHFIVSTGDNFYENGVQSISDSQWQTSFEDVYNADIKWYAVLGNHDYYQNPDAQIEYSSSRWNMDGHYYYKIYHDLLCILYIDTIYLVPHWSDTTVPHHHQRKKELMDFIEMALEKTSSRWIFVVGHYPVYSVGHHGDTPYDSKLIDLFKKYKIDAFLSGHDHSLQHLQKDGIEFFVSGSGSKLGKIIGRTKGHCKFARTESGFVHFYVTDTYADVRFLSVSGDSIYNYRMTKDIILNE